MERDIKLQIVALLPRLRAFALALARNPHDADDLVQATCVRALGGLSGFAEGTRLDAWLFRILRNLWIDEFRRTRPSEPLDDAADVAGEDGRLTTEWRLTARDVQTAILALSEEQREVLALVCVEEMSYRDTADILDVSQGTVMSRLSRARRALATALEAEVAEKRA